jgi:hypothetical protein
MRMEACALRRDIKQAQALIDQLERRYLNGDGSATRNSQLSSSSAPLFRAVCDREPDYT